MVLGAGDAGGQVGEDEIVPAEIGDQPIGAARSTRIFHSSSLTWPWRLGISTLLSAAGAPMIALRCRAAAVPSTCLSITVAIRASCSLALL
jgi:hypothetical protein